MFAFGLDLLKAYNYPAILPTISSSSSSSSSRRSSGGEQESTSGPIKIQPWAASEISPCLLVNDDRLPSCKRTRVQPEMQTTWRRRRMEENRGAER